MTSLTLPVSFAPQVSSPLPVSPLSSEQRRYYWRVRALMNAQKEHKVLVIAPDCIQTKSLDPWKDLRIAIEWLIFEDKLALSYSLAADKSTILLQRHADDTYDPAIPPICDWFSIARPCVRCAESQPVQSSAPSLSPVQGAYMVQLYKCMGERPNSHVLCIDPYNFSIASIDPINDCRKALEWMLYEEKTILAMASCEGNKFLVMIFENDCIEGDLHATRTSDWISLKNPNDRESKGPMVSKANQEASEQLASHLKSGALDVQTVLPLFPNLTTLPDPWDDKSSKAVLEVLLHAGENWYREKFPTLCPTLFSRLVLEALVLDDSTLACQVLHRWVQALNALPKHHPLIYAFINGFPHYPCSASNLKSVMRSELRCDWEREKKKLPLLNPQKSNNVWVNGMQFVLTSFKIIANQLNAPQRSRFVISLGLITGRFLSHSDNQQSNLQALNEIWDREADIWLFWLAVAQGRAGYFSSQCFDPNFNEVLAHTFLEKLAQLKGHYCEYLIEIFCYLLIDASRADTPRVFEWILRNLIKGGKQERKALAGFIGLVKEAPILNIVPVDLWHEMGSQYQGEFLYPEWSCLSPEAIVAFARGYSRHGSRSVKNIMCQYVRWDLSRKIAEAFEAKRWRNAYELFQTLDAADQIRLLVPAYFALEIREDYLVDLPFSQLFLALFHDGLRQKLVSRIARGGYPENSLSVFAKNVDDFLAEPLQLDAKIFLAIVKNPSISESFQDRIVRFGGINLRIATDLLKEETIPDAHREELVKSMEFYEKVQAFRSTARGVASYGGPRCPLRKQYDNPLFSDVEIQIGELKIQAHKELLLLTPFFSSFKDKIVDRKLLIPQEDERAAHNNLREIYGNWSLSELVSSSCRNYLSATTIPRIAHLSFQSCDCTLLVDGKKILAHKIILASAFPFFGFILGRDNSVGSPQNPIVLRDHSHEGIRAAIRTVYGFPLDPEYDDPNSPETKNYYRALDFLKKS